MDRELAPGSSGIEPRSIETVIRGTCVTRAIRKPANDDAEQLVGSSTRASGFKQRRDIYPRIGPLQAARTAAAARSCAMPTRTADSDS